MDANRYYMDSSDTSEYIRDTDDRVVTFPTAKEFMNAFADAGDDRAELDELKENAEKLLKRYTGTDKENKEQIFTLLNEALTYDYTDDDTDDIDEYEDPCEKFDEIKNEAAFALVSYQKIKMMHATSENIDALEIIDDAVESEIIQTESTKKLKGCNTGSWDIYNILDESVDTQFFEYDYNDLSIHKKITEQWLTDSEKEEYTKLLGGNKLSQYQKDMDAETFAKIEAYNILAATRLAKNILNTDY